MGEERLGIGMHPTVGLSHYLLLVLRSLGISAVFLFTK